MFDLTPSLCTTVVFAASWSCGWLLLCRPRRLAQTTAVERPAIAIVIPARNEEAVIGALVTALGVQRRPGDELVVVDDHSTDRTADAARLAGAIVVSPPELPDGWRGKPHACWFGVAHTTAPILLFVDADVHPGAHLLAGLGAELAGLPDGGLLSVQPWHAVQRGSEQLSLLFNVNALMGVGAFGLFGVAGERSTARVAFGPVIACRRSDYMAVGGHAHPDVRRLVTEDIGLARRFATRHLFVGSPDTTTFRMYPDGMRNVVDGWTKSIAYGTSSVKWWLAPFCVAWMSSIIGGWLASPWFYVATALQLMSLARIAGGFRWWISAAHPLATAVFLAVLVRSAWRTLLRRETAWRGRRVSVR